MRILIVDGQGGGVGRSLVEAISKRCTNVDIVAVGTNSVATTNMLRGTGINAATGENAVIYNSRHTDVIIGPIGIVMANAMFGEITPLMAEAISSSEASVILIPMNRCHATVVGVEEKKLSDYIDEVVDRILQMR